MDDIRNDTNKQKELLMDFISAVFDPPEKDRQCCKCKDNSPKCAEDIKDEALHEYAPAFAPEAKTVFKDDGEWLYVWHHDDFYDCLDYTLLPTIKDVEVLPGREVTVRWSDHTITKATVRGNDEFNFEQGISICVGKKLAEIVFGEGFGSTYNKLVEYAFKRYKKNFAMEQKRKAEEAERKAREERRIAKIRKRRKDSNQDRVARQMEYFRKQIDKILNEAFSIK